MSSELTTTQGGAIVTADARAPLLALVDSLQGATLSLDQRETTHALRTGILAFVAQETVPG